MFKPIKDGIILLYLFDESQTRLADFGYIPKCKSKKSERAKRGIVGSRENDSIKLCPPSLSKAG